MKLVFKYNYIILLLFLLGACSDSDSVDIDEEKPTITINYDDGFPQACEVLQRGETYVFKALVTDNQALAAYSIDIHNNFDHHTHDDQEESCVLDDEKEAVNPLTILENYNIEDGVMSYEINITVSIPSDVDTGDYHCAYSVTDETGWQSRTSVDIKIVE
ncbi:DUF4625 domain-containing protein [Formosa sediminum]|uniref:DUF4625 domain-containing protein n=1 Tax=Formosa sediminum TaxID=2594004 RepID=A0A516GM36_9FLAO|nr:DUF4625 domain-containing protein [Formosa sediminum]QDO92584.1 DUF4625 domain-containing protein [Formosa sediminum]